MEIHVRSKGLPSEEVPREAIERRIRFAVNRFEPRLAEVSVQLLDINGPRGGVDKVCVLIADLTHGGRIEARGRSRRSALASVQDGARRLASRIAGAFTPQRLRASIRFPQPPVA